VKLAKDLREFVELLLSRKVEFLVVGGHAVAFHGFPRFTGDIDFFVGRTVDNARRILDALGTFGFADPALDVATLTAPDQVIQLGRPPNRIDILTSISGVAFEDAWRHRIEGDLDGLTVQFIGFDDLRANKTASGRTKDRLDLEQLDRRQR
jgi:predicted nucleotidyltransferase